MKKKEKQSLHEMAKDEVAKHIAGLEAEIVKVKLDRMTKQGKNTRLLRVKRHDIAVAKTILAMRHI